MPSSPLEKRVIEVLKSRMADKDEHEFVWGSLDGENLTRKQFEEKLSTDLEFATEVFELEMARGASELDAVPDANLTIEAREKFAKKFANSHAEHELSFQEFLDEEPILGSFATKDDIEGICRILAIEYDFDFDDLVGDVELSHLPG